MHPAPKTSVSKNSVLQTPTTTSTLPAHPPFLPHIALLLQSMRIGQERLCSRSKVAIDTRLLRALLHSLAGQLPFDPDFYLAQNDDVAAAYETGAITDLRRHFIESGFIEGRFGAQPLVDEAFYANSYKDIGAAIRRGEIVSATEHYIQAGAAEGRIPCEAMRPEVQRWAAVLSD
jgi:hypothetical protein